MTAILFSVNKRENKARKEKQLAQGRTTTDWQSLESGPGVFDIKPLLLTLCPAWPPADLLMSLS